ncbi:uncharacterized protein Z520_10424 [Fonsecaea multimorphosa CBS 102226]|uniref:Mannosyltransferase n=1 Tax=Fonsecaea multimorphosa CBS 102226 TaxID=1442371 RepID=A0A0D2JTG8_9EURO|nr:uncharacterized protein Z520_10424 [Fonsecaea multimorphosa CBS 102226]KIX93799.1 hypothetical protein Z520_10424 [Fonsecaea multimorphosa CBS 102226]OAL19228.1 hypothetical protein AYO22_09989 [Fonsecaea multimorphosa]
MSTDESVTAKAVLQTEKDTKAPSRAHASSPSTARRSSSIASHNVFLSLVGLRLVNALTTRTFFQPDEYFQALEPAWHWAFGEGGGAWITWEWKNHLRSAIHPAVFGLCYQLADFVAEHLTLQGPVRSEVLLAAPKTLQAFFAATADFYTWRLSSYIYGEDSTASLATLFLTVASPWQWFCSTRTFSNSLETTLTVIALCNWPWNWTLPHGRNRDAGNGHHDNQRSRTRDDPVVEKVPADEVTRLRRALLCAAVATILRPTNILIWMILTFLTVVRKWNLTGLSWTECILFLRETVLCGSVILASSAILDRIFYSAWVFPPFNFLQVNVVQSLASFYGNNDWHYYVSQGYPLLLTTVLPFTLIGLFRALSSKDAYFAQTPPASRNALHSLSIICLLVPAAFSVIAHKEVRFIYPLLPALHTVTALPLASFFHALTTPSPSLRVGKRLVLLLILSLNLTISYYITQVHNSGIVDLTHYLRHEFETVYLTSPTPSNMTIGMLMPCHSTPWRSHLQYPPSLTHVGIRAWALTCEPPLNLNATEKSSYLDEADQFYANPSLWVKKHMSRHPPQRKGGNIRPSGSVAGILAAPNLHGKIDTIPTDILESERAEQFWLTGGNKGRQPWPDYLVFFTQLEPTLQVILRGSGYGECKRLFNSHWHDDWRRHGDVVVWCLDPARQQELKTAPAGRDARSRIGMEEVEDAIHDPSALEDIAPGQKILGGDGAATKKGKKARENREADDRKKKPFKRVVEKPFWKVRDPGD